MIMIKFIGIVPVCVLVCTPSRHGKRYCFKTAWLPTDRLQGRDGSRGCGSVSSIDHTRRSRSGEGGRQRRQGARGYLVVEVACRRRSSQRGCQCRNGREQRRVYGIDQVHCPSLRMQECKGHLLVTRTFGSLDSAVGWALSVGKEAEI